MPRRRLPEFIAYKKTGLLRRPSFFLGFCIGKGGSGGERPGEIEARGSAQRGPPFVRGASGLPMHWCPCLSLCPRPALPRLRPISPTLKTAGGRSPLPAPPPLPATSRSTKRNGRHALTNLNFASRAAFFATVALGLFRHVGIRSSTAIFDGPAAQTHHAHRKRRAFAKRDPVHARRPTLSI